MFSFDLFVDFLFCSTDRWGRFSEDRPDGRGARYRIPGNAI